MVIFRDFPTQNLQKLCFCVINGAGLCHAGFVVVDLWQQAVHQGLAAVEDPAVDLSIVDVTLYC